MNAQRRKQLETVKRTYSLLYTELAALGGKFDDLKNELESIRDEEQDSYDNMPDSIRDGERGDNAQQAISDMEDAIATLESITEFCESNDESEFYSSIEAAQGK